MSRLASLLLAWLAAGAMALAAPGPAPMVRVPGGAYTPLYTLGPKGPKTRVQVATFYLDPYPVTQRQYLEFVRTYPQWRRSQVRRIFCEKGYLQNWRGDLDIDPALADSPVTHVSWFAARAYCQAQGKRLPTQHEWEYAAQAPPLDSPAQSQAEINKRILEWYSKPTPARLAPVGSTYRNRYGLYDMHGLVWEWVEDFNALLMTGESRQDSGLDRNLFCAAGAVGGTDPSDYAAYMRYSYRSSLKASYVVANLGLRGASSTPPPHHATR